MPQSSRVPPRSVCCKTYYDKKYKKPNQVGKSLKCFKCNISKNRNEFSNTQWNKLNNTSWCKNCIKNKF